MGTTPSATGGWPVGPAEAGHYETGATNSGKIRRDFRPSSRYRWSVICQSDLQKVATRYQGTRAGAQAALTAAQLMYDQKKYKEGIAALEKAEPKAPDDFKASIHVLEAAGYEELKDFVSGAAQYKLAATATRFPADKAQYQAAAARDYMAAGKKDEAKALWTELAKDDTGPMASEAKVRLGEVTAKPMTT